jgi:hypothetical protein
MWIDDLKAKIDKLKEEDKWQDEHNLFSPNDPGLIASSDRIAIPVSAELVEKFRWLLGHVNSEPIAGADPETIMIGCIGWTHDEGVMEGGTVHFKVRRYIPWTYLFDSDGKPVRVVDDAGKPLYDSTDFNLIGGELSP